MKNPKLFRDSWFPGFPGFFSGSISKLLCLADVVLWLWFKYKALLMLHQWCIIYIITLLRFHRKNAKLKKVLCCTAACIPSSALLMLIHYDLFYTMSSHITPAIIPIYPAGITTISESLSPRRPTPTDLYKAINQHCAIFSGQVQCVSAWGDCYGLRTDAKASRAVQFDRRRNGLRF